jgi:hypothetical protein
MENARAEHEQGGVMRRGFRAALIAAGGAAVALVWSGSALAAYTPQFIVNHSPNSVASATTKITINVPREDDATFKVTFYAPPGYQGVLGQAAGTQVGTVAASVQALRISPDAVLPLTGTIVTADPARFAANQCAPGTHRAVWLLRLEAAGRTLEVPVYLDVPEGPEASFSSFKFQACLPSPHLPEEVGGAAFGAKLLNAQLQLQSGLLTTPATAGRYVWPAIFTPWPNGPGLPNAAGTVQSRGIAQIPGQATLRAQYTARTNTYRLTGSVTENLVGIAGATVDIFKGFAANRLTRIARTRSGANGSFARSGRVQPRRRTFFRARATVPDRVNTTVGCAIDLPLPPAPGGCVAAVFSGFTTQSRVVSVNPPRRR